MARKSSIKRKTKETDIKVDLTIEGKGKSNNKTTIKFLDHMLDLLAKHGLFDLKVKTRSLDKDQHHLVEDIGIALGQAFNKALGNKKGINRAGYFVMPMDESLAIAAVDIGGRPYLKFDAEFKDKAVGVNNLQCNLHIQLPYGRTTHHRIEAIFKSFSRALSMACEIGRIKDKIPSTKGKI